MKVIFGFRQSISNRIHVLSLTSLYFDFILFFTSALQGGESASTFFLKQARIAAPLPKLKKQLRIASDLQTAFSWGVIVSAAEAAVPVSVMAIQIKIYFMQLASLLHGVDRVTS
jgi:hypothetical protein